MRRFINLGVIVLVLLSISIGEQILAAQTFSKMEDNVTRIEQMLSENVDISSDEFIGLVQEMKKTWQKKESFFIVFINYKDLRDIGYEMAKMEANAKKKELPMFMESFESMKFHLTSTEHLVVFSFKNLI